MRSFVIFFFNDTATTEIYTLSLHDALPIWSAAGATAPPPPVSRGAASDLRHPHGSLESRWRSCGERSEEHTSELQSQSNLVCRLLLEKKNNPHATILPGTLSVVCRTAERLR